MISVLVFTEHSRALIPRLFQLLIEEAAPDADNHQTVDVKHFRYLDEAIGLIRYTVHEDELVRKAQIHDQCGATHDQVRLNESLDQQDGHH